MMSQPRQSTNLSDARGIVAVVTEGGSGLGLFMTRALAENGTKKVYIIGRRQQILGNAVREIGLDNVVSIQCDVINRENHKAAGDIIEKDVGFFFRVWIGLVLNYLSYLAPFLSYN
ncbi:Uncharacterized protein HZ326_30343 [Fusarium oxysporum f. sp. albedinis]|nr:Uncharacterized protein HZ326_30343 [Fusarium oxysporum f. sp. albedinis]